LGRPADASREWEQSRELFREVSHFPLIAFIQLYELRDVALTYRASEPGYRRQLAAGAEAALGKAGGALRPGVTPQLAWLNCLIADGRWDEADQILRDLPEPGNCYLRRELTDAAATLSRHRGDVDAAWARIHPLFPDGPRTEPGDIIHQEGLFLQRLAAELCLDQGDVEQAQAWLEAHDRWAAWAGCVLGRAEGQVVWARLRQAGGDLQGAQAHAAAALDLATAPDQPAVRLAAYRLLGELATSAGDHDGARAQLTSALELATECAMPFDRALTLLALAEGRLAAGAPDEAASVIAEVHDICVPLRAAPTLARADVLARRATTTYPAGLTRREVEVLRLLAHHRTDKEIAEALYISPRTVGTHVGNILNKLGVRTRHGARDYAVAHHLD
jgi:DNA-binding CsgD family transcriptional regulator